MRKTMLVGMLMAAIGCGQNSEPIDRDQGELKAFGASYSAFQNAKGKPPETLAELIEFQTQTDAVGLPAVVGRMKVVWGTGLGSLYREGSPSETIFAYSSDANGFVPVLLADGNVKAMTLKDFDAAKKVTRLPKR